MGVKLGWIAAFFALAGQIFMIFKSPMAFILWSIGEGLLMALSIKRKKWGEVAFFSFYIVTNLIALAAWTLEKTE